MRPSHVFSLTAHLIVSDSSARACSPPVLRILPFTVLTVLTVRPWPVFVLGFACIYVSMGATLTHHAVTLGYSTSGPLIMLLRHGPYRLPPRQQGPRKPKKRTGGVCCRKRCSLVPLQNSEYLLTPHFNAHTLVDAWSPRNDRVCAAHPILPPCCPSIHLALDPPVSRGFGLSSAHRVMLYAKNTSNS